MSLRNGRFEPSHGNDLRRLTTAVIQAAPCEQVFENLRFLKYRRLPGNGRRRAMKLTESAKLRLRLSEVDFGPSALELLSNVVFESG